MSMRKSVLRSAGALALLLAAGCMRQETQGPEDEAARLAQIRKKHETCAEVLHMASSTQHIDCRVALMGYSPVCGVDGRTYDNHCVAQGKGVDVAYDRACIANPDTCGIGDDDRPDDGVCIALWDPVCGADGKTYGNACEAGRAGAKVAHDGPCKGDSNVVIPNPIPNPDTGFCKTPAPVDPVKPVNPDSNLVCLTVWDPVCGDDGKTYGNECEAKRAGVKVGGKGKCGAPIPVDRSDDPCMDCSTGGCVRKDAPECRPTLPIGDPDGRVCTMEYAPVCGTDGVTYSNQCMAGSTPIAHKGACSR